MNEKEYIAQLQAELAVKNDRIALLEQEIGIAGDVLRYPGLTRQQTTVLRVLLRNETPRKSTFMAALYSGSWKEYPDEKIVDIFIHQLRKRLKVHNIKIETVWGVGYRMSEACKKTARAAVCEGA